METPSCEVTFDFEEVFAVGVYTVEALVEAEVLVLQGEQFGAVRVCKHYREDQQVVLGLIACVTAA